MHLMGGDTSAQLMGQGGGGPQLVCTAELLAAQRPDLLRHARSAQDQQQQWYSAQLKQPGVGTVQLGDGAYWSVNKAELLSTSHRKVMQDSMASIYSSMHADYPQ